MNTGGECPGSIMITSSGFLGSLLYWQELEVPQCQSGLGELPSYIYTTESHMIVIVSISLVISTGYSY